MRAMTRISGRKLTTATWLMYSRFKAKSQRQSPSNCKHICLLEKKPRSTPHRLPTWSLTTFFCARGSWATCQIILTRREVLQAITLLEEALRRDPKFLRAHCLMCEIHLDLYWE